MSLILNGTTGISDVDGTAAAPALTGTDSNTGIFFPAADTIAFAEGGAEAMRIDSSGNVGIGTSSPAYKLQVNGGSLNNNNDANTAVATGTNHVRLKINTPTTGGFRASLILSSDEAVTGTAKEVAIGTTGSSEMQFATSNTERMRIDSSGNLLVGKTDTSNAVQGLVLYPDGQMRMTTNGTASATIIGFFRNSSATLVGSINTTSTATSYVTSSDYRLKENIQPMTGALAKVAALKPVTYTWKSTGEADEGFIAHELQEVCPSAVVGEKNAVDADGNPQYQGIDTSFLVATLTAALQELKAINDAQAQTIESLTARVVALENQIV